jgi:diguanylate cyclase (GGDEF)-like protein
MSKRMLVVEDSKSIATVIERMGSSLGYKVTIAPSFAAVKQLLAQKHNFFVATLDYGLPDAPNGEVIPFVLEHNIPSIVMTGRMDDATHKKMFNLPIIDYITKENAQAYHYLLRILNGQLNNRQIAVLVVDDSLTSRNHISQLLKRRNFIVHSVADGVKAMHALEQFPNIKMVITDQGMPGMGGIKLVQRIRKSHTKDDLIIIGLSGANRDFQSTRFIKNGADDFLRKPFCPEEFYCRIMQNIEKMQHLKEIKLAANQDYLTSLFNRRYFLELAKEIHENLDSSKLYVLSIIYIDDFKNINENISHEMGDNVLIETSKLLTHHFKGHLTARLGGAEFGLLVSDNDEKYIEERIEKFKKLVEKHTTTAKNVDHHFTVSIGGTIIKSENSLSTILKEADNALHDAISKGGNKSIMNGFIELG